MHSSSVGFDTLSAWQRSNTPLRLFSFGSVSYVREEGTAGAAVRIAPIGATDRVVVEVCDSVPGVEPTKPSFDMKDALFVRFTPNEGVPKDVSLFAGDINRFKLFLWVWLRDNATLLFAEPR